MSIFQAMLKSIRTLALAALAIPALLQFSPSAFSASSWSLASPDGKCRINVSLEKKGALAYEVRRDGKILVQKSPLGLRRDDQSFETGLVFEGQSPLETRREKYELFSGNIIRVDRAVNRSSLTFRNDKKNRLVIELAASDEGVAFRYSFPEKSSATRVMRAELTGFSLPRDARGWMQPYHMPNNGASTPAYEDFYFRVSPGDPPPKSRAEPSGWAFPALFSVPGAGWVLITETTTDAAYCGTHLEFDNNNGNTTTTTQARQRPIENRKSKIQNSSPLYRIAFPTANELTKNVPFPNTTEPRHTLPWTMPWRVFVLGATAADIAMSTLVTDLAPPSRIKDTSWIRPGRASWSWWYHAGNAGNGPCSDYFDQYSDFAAKMGWEYTLFDAGWGKQGVNMPARARNALAQNVIPLAWFFAGGDNGFYTPEARKKNLDKLTAAKVQGMKVDFWCSDRQESIAAMLALFEEAAARRINVNLHGCTLPRGWHRTWPNFLTAEAVLGGESYMFERRFTNKAAELNTVLPFTRNVTGPMDYTPVACSPKKHPRTTTAAHELATAIIFNSGIVHYADSPEYFESLPPAALKIFRDAPARWDETRILVADPGSLVVFARRAGDTWFIAGINGKDTSQPVTLDLSAFAQYPARLLISESHDDPLMQVTATADAVNPATTQWLHDRLPPRGGFILRLDKR